MVVIRGHIRTWNYVSGPTLEFYDSLAENVDYYVCTWQMENMNTIAVEEKFKNRNLIKFLQLWQNPDISSAWAGPAYHSYMLLPYKRLRERELGVKYDAVIDTRFDIMIGQNYEKTFNEYGSILTNKPITKIEPNTLYTDMIDYSIEQEPNLRLPRPSDHWFIMSSDMYQPFTERFIRKEKYSCHEEFYLMCKDEGWSLGVADWAKTMIVRPNMIDAIKNPYHFFEYEKAPRVTKGLHDYNHEWITMPPKDRISYCKNHGINPLDYEFQMSLVPVL